MSGRRSLRGELAWRGVKDLVGDDAFLGEFEGNPALESAVEAGKAWPALEGDIGPKLPAGSSLCIYSAAELAASRPRAYSSNRAKHILNEVIL